MAQIQVKNKVKASTVMMGFLLIIIPVLMGVLVCIPTFGQWVIASKGDIFKGFIVGVSLLPVLLFIAIKGGEIWYKRWWTWGIIAVSIGILALIVVMSKGVVGGTVPPAEGQMMDQGVQMGGMGKG